MSLLDKTKEVIEFIDNILDKIPSYHIPSSEGRLSTDRLKHIKSLLKCENMDIDKQIIETVKGSDGIALNAGDFFNYACADMILLEYEDFHWAMPIMEKYGNEGEQAVMSKIANTLPVPPHRTTKFTKALDDINSKDIKVWSQW